MMVRRYLGGVGLSARDPDVHGRQTALAELRQRLSDMKSGLIKALLSVTAVVAVAAQLIDPLGDVLEDQEFLGSSFAAVVALILFDAISDTTDREVAGVEVYGTLSDLDAPAKTAFEAKHVKVFFSGFTMETLYDVLRDRLMEVHDGKIRPKKITLRIIVVHLENPMNLPGALEPDGRHTGKLLFHDSRENRERMREDFTLKYWGEFRALLDTINAEHPHISIKCEVRESPHGPQSKLFILNEERAIYGTYGIKKETFTRNGRTHRILDSAGFGIKHGDARYIGWDVRSPTKTTRQVANYHMAWFQNLWDVLDEIKPMAPVINDPVWTPSRGGATP